MNQGTGFLLIVVSLLIMYGVLMGKYPVFEKFFYELFDLTTEPEQAVKKENVPVSNVELRGIEDTLEATRRAVERMRNLGRRPITSTDYPTGILK